MKRHMFAIMALVLVGAVCLGPAAAQTPREKEEATAKAGHSHSDSKPSDGSSETSSTTTTTTSTDKEKERRENEIKEYKARREIERRKRIEREREYRYHPGIGYDRYDYDYGYGRRRNIDYAYDDTSDYGPSERPRAQYEPKGFSAGVVFAPGHGDRDPAVGIQWLGNRGWGAGVWFSGDITRNDDTIDGMIPHSDYFTEKSRGSLGFQALFTSGSKKAMLITGIGLVVDRTYHTAVSNVTGWKWNAGSDAQTKLAAQVGCRFRLGGPISMHIGYDTIQNAFFGLSGEF